MALLLPSALPTLITSDGRYRLRRATRLDASRTVRILRNPLVWDQGFGGGTTRPTTTLGFHAFARDRLTGVHAFSITDTTTGRLVGTTGLTSVGTTTDPDAVKMGRTLIDPAYWGTGVNHVVKDTLMSWLFDCGATEVTCDVHPDNQRSLRSLTRYGFTIVGNDLIPTEDGFREVTVLSIPAAAWDEKHGSSLRDLARAAG